MKYTEQYWCDLEKVQKVVPNLEVFYKKRILITGASGMIGSAIVDFLLQLNRIKKYEVEIFVAGRNKTRVKERFGSFFQDTYFHFLQYDATEKIEFTEEFDYIIHAASNANPLVYAKFPVETMISNFDGMLHLLEYAQKHDVSRVLYVSSSEVYGNKKSLGAYKETDYGYVDLLNPRACYPLAKRATETLCSAYRNEYGIDFVIVRPGHIYGPTMTENDTRASSQFARDIIEEKDIVMKSSGLQQRSYCYVLDCVSAILTVLIQGKAGEAYNISNPNSVCTIREIAEAFAEEGKRKVIFENATEAEKKRYNLMENSVLDAKKILDLGWKGIFTIEEGVARTIDGLKRTMGSNPVKKK